jgi:hypothetical protein
MKSIFTFAAFFVVCTFSSCSKQTDDRVYIRFVNTSAEILNKAHIQSFLATTSEAHSTHISIGNLQPAEVSGYIGFNDLCYVDGMPIIEFVATLNSKELKNSVWCGTGTRNMAKGKYTAEIVAEENFLVVHIIK